MAFTTLVGIQILEMGNSDIQQKTCIQDTIVGYYEPLSRKQIKTVMLASGLGFVVAVLVCFLF